MMTAEDEKEARIQASVDALIAKHGSVDRVIEVLTAENVKYRAKFEELRAKVPGEGDIVLTPEEAETWKEYREFGEPESLAEALAEGPKLKAEVEGHKAEIERDKTFAAACELAKFRPAAARQLGLHKLALSVESGSDDAGRPIRMAFVREADGSKVPLTEYAQRECAMFLPVLRGESQPSARRPGTPASNDFNAPPPPIRSRISGQNVQAAIGRPADPYDEQRARGGHTM